MQVLKTIMGYEYLWFHIRVQGGAYGCMFQSTQRGDLTFVTYRDPHLKRSNEIFERVPDYLEHFDADERELTKFVIGTMSGVDAPLTPAGKGSRDMNIYMAEVDAEDRQKTRDGIIDCSLEDIRALAPLIRKALDAGNICVIGNEKKIEEEKGLFLETKNLFA